jgi:hypothetical protein
MIRCYDGQADSGNRTPWFPVSLFLLVFAWASIGAGWECQDATIFFTHKPSDYYGSGEYFASCPETGTPIRCYHYHRHWVCEKGETYYWDRNLESAARTACGCPLPPGVAPASPAVSENPAKRLSFDLERLSE